MKEKVSGVAHPKRITAATGSSGCAARHGSQRLHATDFGGSWTEVTSRPQARVELTVEAVPEASTALPGLVAVGVGLRRRRR